MPKGIPSDEIPILAANGGAWGGPTWVGRYQEAHLDRHWDLDHRFSCGLVWWGLTYLSLIYLRGHAPPETSATGGGDRVWKRGGDSISILNPEMLYETPTALVSGGHVSSNKQVSRTTLSTL